MYPLVNVYIIMEITIFNGKIHYKWTFSIAMLVITRGYCNFHHGFWPMDDPIFIDLSTNPEFTEEWRSFDLHFCNCPWQKSLASTNLAIALAPNMKSFQNVFLMDFPGEWRDFDCSIFGGLLCCTYIVPTWRVKPHEWWSRCRGIWIPSGKLTVCYWKWPREIVDLPIKVVSSC